LVAPPLAPGLGGVILFAGPPDFGVWENAWAEMRARAARRKGDFMIV
jgi:hypothetical protein